MNEHTEKRWARSIYVSYALMTAILVVMLAALFVTIASTNSVEPPAKTLSSPSITPMPKLPLTKPLGDPVETKEPSKKPIRSLVKEHVEAGEDLPSREVSGLARS